MKRAVRTVGPLVLAALIIWVNGGTSSILSQTTTRPVPTQSTAGPTTQTTEPPTATVPPDASGTTRKEGNGVPVTSRHKPRRGGKLARTGPGDDAGNFRLILFNGGFVLLMIGAIFFAVKRRVERRYWWNMSSKM